MTPQEIDAMAARMKVLERLALVAFRFRDHLRGFRLATDDGEVNMMAGDIPEWIALDRVVDELRALEATND